jgi:hypothetical protein
MNSGLIVIPTGRARSNHAEVARSIGIDIIAGRYGEGARIPGDAELLATFGVSRTVLRESVKTLVAKGLLTTKAGVGTVVRGRSAWNMFDVDVLAWHLDVGIDKRFLSDLAEIRLAVEPQAAALAATRRTDADIAELRRSMQIMGNEPPDSTAFADGDLALHRGRERLRQSLHALDRRGHRGGAARIVSSQRAGRAGGSRDGAALAPAHRGCDRRGQAGAGCRGDDRGDLQRHPQAWYEHRRPDPARPHRGRKRD